VSTAAPSTSLDYVEEYAAAANRFAAAVAESDLRVPVATCPGWSTYDLVVHLGNVHAWAATIVETGRRAAEQNDKPRMARARSASRWYAAKAEDLREVLREVPPDRPCWNFAYGVGVVGFWSRRQLHETTIHQVDLDLTGQRETALPAGLCADGVGEALTVFLRRMHSRGFVARLEEPLALTASDIGDTWLVSPSLDGGPPSARAVDPDPRGVRDRVEGPAEVLYRVLWKRTPVDDPALVVTGDRARVLAFLGSRLVP
jgi:uncharacterized protein (TIGR03083 family)